MRIKCFTMLLGALLCVISVHAQKPLYACGGFNGWNPKEPAEFSYSEGLYSLEIDFSEHDTFKLSTVKGVNGNGWDDFDTGTLTLDAPATLNEWIHISFKNRAPNITAPAKSVIKVVVDLDNMMINFGGEGEKPTAWSGTLPVLFINTENYEPVVEKETYLTATYYIDPMGVPGVETIGSKDEPLTTQIKGRGNYSWIGFDKKPYRLKLASKEPLLGMPKSKHFVLLAHADDNNGFLRNETGFTLSKILGMPWTPESQPVELVLNGNYRGLYFLTQNIRVDKDRVNITEQEDFATTDVDGGWLVEIDNYNTDPHVTVFEDGNSSLPIWFTYKSPEELSAEQENYLQSQMQAIDNAVYASDTGSDNPGLASLVDLDILARYYITQEVVDDGESFHGSCYLNRDRGADCKWLFGPVWDFGNAFLRGYSKKFIWQQPPFHQVWIGTMYKFKAFRKAIDEVWRTYLANGPEELKAHLDEFIDKIAVAAEYDYRRWPQYGNADVKAKYAEVLKLIDAKTAWLIEQWGGTTDIQAAESENDAGTDVYNLQGVKVLSGASQAEINALPAGLYMTPHGKILIP